MKHLRLLAGFVAAICTGAAFAGTKYVVIAGVIQPHDHLRYTINDAELMQTILGGPNSEIMMLLPPGSDSQGVPDRATLIKEIAKEASKAGPDDTFWFYYSGHGASFENDPHSYICPYDFKTIAPENFIDISQLRQSLKDHCKAKAIVIILDSCHAGSEKSLMAANLESAFGSASGINTMAACQLDQTSMEMPELKHGVFTYFLARGLAGAASDSGSTVTLQGLRDYVTRETDKFVEGASGGTSKQTPVFMIDAGNMNTPVAQTNPTALQQIPPPPAATVVRPSEPLSPGIIVTLAGTNDTDRSSVDDAEARIRNGLVEEGYPVVSSEQASEFLDVLRNRDTEDAAKQAKRMHCRFLLRGNVTVHVKSESFNGEQTYTADVTITAQVVDSDGAVALEFSSDSDDGIPARGPGFSEATAVRSGIARATKVLMAKVEPALEKRVRSRLKG